MEEFTWFIVVKCDVRDVSIHIPFDEFNLGGIQDARNRINQISAGTI